MQQAGLDSASLPSPTLKWRLDSHHQVLEAGGGTAPNPGNASTGGGSGVRGARQGGGTCRAPLPQGTRWRLTWLRPDSEKVVWLAKRAEPRRGARSGTPGAGGGLGVPGVPGAGDSPVAKPSASTWRVKRSSCACSLWLSRCSSATVRASGPARRSASATRRSTPRCSPCMSSCSARTAPSSAAS